MTSSGHAHLLWRHQLPNTFGKQLLKLREDKASWPYDIGPKLLSHLSEEVSQLLYVIYRKSLDTGVVPDDWRRANVSPIFKSGNRGKAENYRPVSLTCVLCKVFEMVLRDALVQFLEERQLLVDSQHGFRKGRSCLSNLLIFLERVTRVIDEGDSVDVVFWTLLRRSTKCHMPG